MDEGEDKLDEQEDPGAETVQQEEELPRSLLKRQLLFLRRTWWSTEPLTPWQRISLAVRGLFLIAIGFVGLITSVAGTLNTQSNGMNAIAKIMAEFMLIPIGLLALIAAGIGTSLIVRSFVSASLSREFHD